MGLVWAAELGGANRLNGNPVNPELCKFLSYEAHT